MNRFTIIQSLIDATLAKTYLEIGVNTGEIFFAIKAPKKIAVDPQFKFSQRGNIRKMGVVNKLIRDNSEAYFEETSDDFFAKRTKYLEKLKIDVAFVDGLHTYMQAYRDILNCLKYLSPKGVIIVHDCNPVTPAAETPVKHSINEVLQKAERGEIAGWTGHWNGDVWKALVRLQCERSDLNVVTLDIDWGVAVITRSDNGSRLDIKPEDISKLSYQDLEQNRVNWLNLKEPLYLNKLVEQSKG